MRKLYTLLIGIAMSSAAVAQDIHFSQFYHAPLQLNPALTGVFNGDYRLTGNFRSQWFTVPVSYTTFKVGFDARLFPDRIQKDVLAAGLMVYHDQAGDSRLSTLYASSTLAYHKRITERFFMGAGVMLGFAQRRFNRNYLTFDDQFNGDVFDPNIQSGDLANLPRSTFSYFDVAVGLNFRYQKDSRLFFNWGAGLHHPHSPKASFMGTDARIGTKLIAHFNGSFPVHARWDLQPHVMVQWQKTYLEAIFGGLARYHFNENPGREMALFFGASYRMSDAIVPVVGFSYQTWQVGLSYDVNVSKFVPATANNGGIELSFVYIWRRFPKLPSIKICPIL